MPGTLRQTADFLAAQPWSSRIVVVDNASVDETGPVVRKLSREAGSPVPISVIGCARRGKGAAVRRGAPERDLAVHWFLRRRHGHSRGDPGCCHVPPAAWCRSRDRVAACARSHARPAPTAGPAPWAAGRSGP
ncbi:hypothetical protein AAHB34_06320 [Paenarthrobacter ureafaciens]